MVEILSECDRKARKQHRCWSCLGAICVGEKYHEQRQVTSDGIGTVRGHIRCETASRIVAGYMDSVDLQDGLPRVCDMVTEDRDTVRADDPEVARAIWGPE